MLIITEEQAIDSINSAEKFIAAIEEKLSKE